jgi:hypothetical protein
VGSSRRVRVCVRRAYYLYRAPLKQPMRGASDVDGRHHSESESEVRVSPSSLVD